MKTKPLALMALAVLTVVQLAVIGVLIKWPPWWIALFAVIVTSTVAFAVWCAKSARFTETSEQSQRRIYYAVAALALIVAVVCIFSTVRSWTVPEMTRSGDKAAVTTVSRQVSEKVASLTAGNVQQYMSDLKPYATNQVIAALKTQVLDRLPANASNQQATVRAISIEALLPDGASTVAILDRQRSTQAGPVTDQIQLWLLLSKVDGHWLVQNVGLVV